MYGPAGPLDLWLQLDSGEGGGKGRKGDAGAEERHHFESETQRETQKDIQRGRDRRSLRKALCD